MEVHHDRVAALALRTGNGHIAAHRIVAYTIDFQFIANHIRIADPAHLPEHGFHLLSAHCLELFAPPSLEILGTRHALDVVLRCDHPANLGVFIVKNPVLRALAGHFAVHQLRLVAKRSIDLYRVTDLIDSVRVTETQQYCCRCR